MTLPLNNMTALVTGATRGIGHAIATRLLADGANVIASGRHPDGQGPDGSSYMAVDFSDPAATEAFAEEIRSMPIDILINNAGINRVAPFADISITDFQLIQQINVTTPFLLCRAVVPTMQKNGWGRIVNISSIWSTIAKAGRGSYAASKFAIDGMTAALAAEVAADYILVNCVAPGFIDTELTRKTLGASGMAELAMQVPLRRLGQPEEVANFVAWLAGPENTYISGQNLVIDGGFSRV